MSPLRLRGKGSGVLDRRACRSSTTQRASRSRAGLVSVLIVAAPTDAYGATLSAIVGSHKVKQRRWEAAVTKSQDDEQLTGRLTVVAVLTFVLIIPPVLAQFDYMGRIFGVPVIWAYLYLVWAIVIIVVAVIGGRSR